MLNLALRLPPKLDLRPLLRLRQHIGFLKLGIQPLGSGLIQTDLQTLPHILIQLLKQTDRALLRQGHLIALLRKLHNVLKRHIGERYFVDEVAQEVADLAVELRGRLAGVGGLYVF
jgi:hypothetical protein